MSHDSHHHEKNSDTCNAASGSERASAQRTETEYLLMLDYVTAHGGTKSRQRRLDPGTTEAEALALASEWLALEHPPYRVEVFSREVPVEWTKVEELRG